MIILIPIVLNVIIIMVTYSDVRDLRFLKASAAMERISLLLRSLKYFSNDDDDDDDDDDDEEEEEPQDRVVCRMIKFLEVLLDFLQSKSNFIF